MSHRTAPHVRPTTRPSRLAAAALAVLTILGALGLSSGRAAAAPVPATSKFCTTATQQKYVTALAAKIKVPAPVVVTDPGSAHGAYFTPGTSTISVRPGCASKSTLAHEFGHYVIDLAAGMDWGKHREIASVFTQFRNWLKSSADAEGFERAAHCVGYQFVKNGTYTRCPQRAARDTAKYLTKVAASLYPAP
jgi:hypothetical protein